jgi:hypothetical protein
LPQITGTTVARPQLRKLMAVLTHGDVAITPAVDRLAPHQQGEARAGRRPERGDMSLEGWSLWVNRVYFGAGGVAAFATVITVLAGVAQNRINNVLTARRDREFSEFRIASDKQIAELHRATAEANQKAEEERLARMKIEERLAPRSITVQQVQKVAEAISEFSGTDVAVMVAGETQEIGSVAQAVVAMLRVAGWKSDSWIWTGVGPFSGINVATKPAASQAEEGAPEALVKALIDVGLAAASMTWPPDNWDSFGGLLNGPPQWDKAAPIRIVIGAKP